MTLTFGQFAKKLDCGLDEIMPGVDPEELEEWEDQPLFRCSGVIDFVHQGYLSPDFSEAFPNGDSPHLAIEA